MIRYSYHTDHQQAMRHSNRSNSTASTCDTVSIEKLMRIKLSACEFKTDLYSRGHEVELRNVGIYIDVQPGRILVKCSCKCWQCAGSFLDCRRYCSPVCSVVVVDSSSKRFDNSSSEVQLLMRSASALAS
jgi:hypothetical protein